MTAYVLLVVSYVNGYAAISQQEYSSKEACENARANIVEMVKRERGQNWNIPTRCVAN